MNDLKLILFFLSKNTLMVLSTVKSQTNAPASSLVAYVETPALELYFQTQKKTRKYSNLLENKQVSILTGWESNQRITLQYEGVAQQITDVRHIEEVKQLFLNKKSPSTEKYLNHPDVAFFKLTPSWIRYSDYTMRIPDIRELQFHTAHHRIE